MTQNTADRLYLLLVDRLRVIGGPRHAAEDIAAEIDGYIDTIAQLSVRHDTVAFHAQTVETALIAAAAERDEARAETRRVVAANEDERRADADAIGELRAEIKRLRLPAEAWWTAEAYQAILLGEISEGWDVRLRKAFHIREQAAVRAREVTK